MTDHKIVLVPADPDVESMTNTSESAGAPLIFGYVLIRAILNHLHVVISDSEKTVYCSGRNRNYCLIRRL